MLLPHRIDELELRREGVCCAIRTSKYDALPAAFTVSKLAGTFAALLFYVALADRVARASVSTPGSRGGGDKMRIGSIWWRARA